MSNRTCKKCGRVDFDIWGTIGLIGFSLIVGALGYTVNMIYSNSGLVIFAVVIGLVCMLPMWMISFIEERKELKKNDERVN